MLTPKFDDARHFEPLLILKYNTYLYRHDFVLKPIEFSLLQRQCLLTRVCSSEYIGIVYHVCNNIMTLHAPQLCKQSLQLMHNVCNFDIADIVQVSIVQSNWIV